MRLGFSLAIHGACRWYSEATWKIEDLPQFGRIINILLWPMRLDASRPKLALLCISMLYNNASLSKCSCNLLGPLRDYVRIRQRCERPKPYSVTIK